MTEDFNPRTKSSCRAETLPSPAPHPHGIWHCTLHTQMRRETFRLQLIQEPPSAPPKYRDADEGLSLGSIGTLSH